MWQFGWLKNYPALLSLASLSLLLHIFLTILIIPLARQLEPLLKSFELQKFIYFLALLLLLYAAKGLFFWLQSVAWSRLVFTRTQERRLAFYQKVIAQPLLSWQTWQSGDLLARLTVDLQHLETALLSQLTSFFPNLLLITVLIAYLLWLNPLLTLLTLLILPLGSQSLNLTSTKLRRWSEKYHSERGFVHSEIAETLNSLPSLWPLQVTDWLSRRLELIQNRMIHAQIYQIAWQSAQGPILNWVQVLAIGIVLLTGAWQVQSAWVGVGDLLAFGAAMALSIDPVLALVDAWGIVQIAYSAQKRLDDIVIEPQQALINPATSLETLDDNRSFLLRVDQLAWHFPGQQPLFHGLKFSIQPGEWVALLGPSGAGKSTIINVLAGIYPSQFGILEKNARLTETVLLPQKSAFLHLSLRDNICLGRSISESDLAELLEICQLSDLIKALPLGLDSPMGNQGSLFSGGERQRIALARAMLAKPKLLFLDEATSELDLATEEKIILALKQAYPELGCMLVTHRLSSLASVQRFLLLEHGTISVDGSQADLQAYSAWFRTLINLQDQARIAE
jgi:ABC-type multidrug transport system fused ATPase/permease subunit